MSSTPSTPAAPTPTEPAVHHDLRWLAALWLGLTSPVSGRAYRNTGFGLMLVKYLLDAGLIYGATGRLWQPWDYLSPLMVTRKQVPEWVAFLLVLETLPFMWIGVSMTARRARDAGLSTGLGVTLFFTPFINYVWMLWLCVLPSRSGPSWSGPPQVALEPKWRAALLGIVASVGVGVGMLLLSVFALEGYGAGLFMGSPFLMGVASGYLFNRRGVHTLKETFGVTSLAVSITGGAILLFALEGVVCLAMAAPLAWLMAALGGALGRALASTGPQQALMWLMMGASLPALTGMEQVATPPGVHEVVSTVEINAPPDAVWPFVVGHSALPPPTEWFFRLGIAYPVQSTTFGEGVGAIRHCTFSTGPLEEVITVWDPPSTLRFNATSQPAPMTELTPYNISPPHLDGYVASVAGEFRLTPLPGNRTLLSGSTWYQSSLYPDGYWTLWSDALVHAVHHRVFTHIQTLAEAPPPGNR